MVKYLLCIACLIGLASTGYSQSGKIYIRNSPASGAVPVIQLKWFDQQTLFKKTEVTIYRKATGGFWKKMTDVPVKKGSYKLTSEAFRKDSSLKACVDILDKIHPDSIKGFTLLTLLLKSFESNAFARYAGIMYEDTSAQAGKRYEYKIVIKDKGKERELGVSPEILCGKYTPPTPPSDLVIKAKKRRTEFKWKIETDRYYAVNIYRTAGDSMKEVKITPQPIMVSKKSNGRGGMEYGDALYTDKEVRENVTYTYRLTALDFFGEETGFTQGVSAFVADSTAPSVPDNLKFTVEKYEVHLTWESKADPDRAGFYIYKGKTSKGPFQRVNGASLKSDQTSFEEVSPSGNFYYYVAAHDKAGNESTSNRIFVHVHDLLAPETPRNITVRGDTGRIYLNWLPNSEPDLMGYQIYRSVDNEDTTHFVLMNSKPFAEPFFIDSLSKNIKNKFMYKVIAVDSSYNKSTPSKAVGAQMPDVTPPQRPLIKNAYLSEKKYLKVEWIANADDDLWGYNLYISSEADSASFRQANINLLPSHSTHYTDQKTEAGKLYHYYLVAVDSSGNHSPASEVFTIRNTDSTGSAHQGVSSAKGKFNKKNNEVILQWELPGKDILGTVIYRKDKKDEVLYPLTGMLGSNQYIDKSVAKASTYYYEIRVYSRSGAIDRSGLLKIETEK